MALTYRPDLDGLRALAVLAVVLYHFWPDLVPGGFMGVDLFFVLSGYLITHLLLDSMRAGDFSFRSFYLKRARRLLPALFLVVLLCLLAGLLLQTPREFFRLLESARWTLLFAANFGFWRHQGYFEPDAAGEPLLHTWSLGVEEQFYLAWPLLIWLGWRLGGHNTFVLIALLLAVGGASMLAGGTDLSQHVNRGLFYLPHLRAWEFVVGALLVFAPRIRWDWMRSMLLLCGLCLAGWAAFTVEGRAPFTRLHLLLRCLAAALIIYGGVSLLGRLLLGNRLMLWVGRRSYSLYLLHWPLFSFVHTGALHRLPGWAAPVLLIVSLIGAHLMYRYLELPWHRGYYRLDMAQWPGRLAVLSVCFVGAALIVFPQFKEQVYQLQAGSAVYEELLRIDDGRAQEMRLKAQRIPDCHLTLSEDTFDTYMDRFESCNELKPASYAVIGDSHASDLHAALRAAYPEHNFLQFTFNNGGGFIRRESARLADFAFTFLDFNAPDIAGVIFKVRGRQPDSKWIKVTYRKLVDLQAAGVPVLVIGPHPEYDPPVPELLAHYRRNHGFAAFAHEYRVASVDELDQRLAPLVARWGLTYVSLIEPLCPQEVCMLLEPGNNRLMVFDYGHWTAAGIEHAAQRIRARYPDPADLFSQSPQ